MVSATFWCQQGHVYLPLSIRLAVGTKVGSLHIAWYGHNSVASKKVDCVPLVTMVLERSDRASRQRCLRSG